MVEFAFDYKSHHYITVIYHNYCNKTFIMIITQSILSHLLQCIKICDEHTYCRRQWKLIYTSILYAKQKQPGAVKKGAAK